MRCAFRRVALVLMLGTATALASAVALALCVPLELYPKQDSYIFLAGGRAWNAVQRERFGVWVLWWAEIDAAYMLPPPVPGAAPDPSVPTTPEGWVEYAREDRKSNHPPVPPTNHDDAPSWGTFAFGGSGPAGVRMGSDHGFGWPLPAMWYRVRGMSSGGVATATGVDGGWLVSDAAMLSVRGYDFRALPLRVHWPGLAVNSTLLAALWAVLLYAPAAARRRLRHRRGLCLRCGYDLKHEFAGGCPECGWNRDAIRGASPESIAG